MKHFLIAIVIISSFVPYASAAQLDAAILSGEESTDPSFQFLRVVYIEYPNNGKISEELRAGWSIKPSLTGFLEKKGN